VVRAGRMGWQGRGHVAGNDSACHRVRHGAAGAEERAQLARASDPWLQRAALSYQDAGYHDGRGADTTPAVRWWVRWTRRRGQPMMQMAPAAAGVQAQRAVEDLLILFAVWLVEVRGVAAATARSYVCTVRAWHGRRFGEMMPGYSPVRLKAVLKGMRMLRPSGRRAPRRGIRTQVLAEGMDTVFGSEPQGRDEQCAVAALSLGFCGLLRVSEYTTHEAKTYDSAKLPVVGDVQFKRDRDGEYASVMIRARKKGQKATGKSDEVIVRDGSLLKPVTALRRMLEGRRRLRSDQPLFVWGGRPLTSRLVTGLVKQVAEAAGCDPMNLGSHALRIGGATAALAAGVPVAAIQAMGRWDSEIYRVYCRRSRQVALHLGTVIASTEFEDMDDNFQDESLV